MKEDGPMTQQPVSSARTAETILAEIDRLLARAGFSAHGDGLVDRATALVDAYLLIRQEDYSFQFELRECLIHEMRELLSYRIDDLVRQSERDGWNLTDIQASPIPALSLSFALPGGLWTARTCPHRGQVAVWRSVLATAAPGLASRRCGAVGSRLIGLPGVCVPTRGTAQGVRARRTLCAESAWDSAPAIVCYCCDVPGWPSPVGAGLCRMNAGGGAGGDLGRTRCRVAECGAHDARARQVNNDDSGVSGGYAVRSGQVRHRGPSRTLVMVPTRSGR